MSALSYYTFSYPCLILLLDVGHLFIQIQMQCIVSCIYTIFCIQIFQIDFPTPRKFHSILPFRNNKIIMFGGAYYDSLTQCHTVVNERIWTFDFERLEWSVLLSTTMPRPTYFHAAAINEVKTLISFFSNTLFLSL